MKWLALVPSVVIAYLIWRGSGSLFRALLGAIALPIAGMMVVGFVLGAEAIEEIGGLALFLAGLLFLAAVVWERMRD